MEFSLSNSSTRIVPLTSMAGEPSNLVGARPLEFAQQRIWDQARSQPTADVNLTALLRLTGAVDPNALEHALSAFVQSQSSLCQRFREIDGKLCRFAHESIERLPLRTESIGRSADDLTVLAQQRAAAEAQVPFDLATGPLIRALLLHASDQDHFLILSAHPLVCDGPSLMRAIRHIIALNAGTASRRNGQHRIPLRPALERDVLPSTMAIDFWSSQLAAASGSLDLPFDRPRGPRTTFRPAIFSFSIPREVGFACRKLAASHRGTLDGVFLAAFQATLQTYGSHNEFAIGVPISTRPHDARADSPVRRSVCYLPVRIPLDEARSFREALSQARDATREAQSHAGPALDAAILKSEASRSPVHLPLFSVAFALRRDRPSAFRAGGLTVTLLDVEGFLPACDLSLEIQTHGPEFSGRLVYNAELFDEPAVAAMAGQYRNFLENLTAQPDLPLRGVSLLGNSDKRTILAEWNQTHADYPNDKCLHQLFEDQAERTPHAVALVHEGRELTYGELNRRADLLASHLRNLGVGPDVPVAICAEPSFDMIVGLFGILKAGGAYVPLDPATPPDRLRFFLSDTKAVGLVTQRRLVGDWQDLSVAVLLLDDLSKQAHNNEAATVGVTPDHLAYVIYTSGSTGTPKGVMVSHRAIGNTLHWRLATFPLGPNDRVLQSFSFTFDASVWELFAPLLAGAQLVLAGADIARDSRRLVELIARHGITVMQTIPSRLGLLLEESGVADCRSLRHVICGGEAMTGALQERFFNRLPESSLHNLYGPTETALDATCWTCRRGDGRTAIPIGRPIGNKRVYLLDRHRRPVPVGVPGELFIGGAGLARGYLGNAALTADRFQVDPFSPGSGSNVYRTGDLCRWLPDGSLLFLGRTDQQLKVRGYRIEPGEIETALVMHPGVRQAVVTARANGSGDSRLVAYVVPADGATPTPAELRNSLRGRLPDYMVPSAVVMLLELPRTLTGKVDLKALPAPEAPTRQQGAALPTGPVERFLATLWEEVLGVKEVGDDDNFFDLGGTSLRVHVLIHRLQDLLGEYVYTVALYDAPTLAGLAQYLRVNYSAAVARLFGKDALNGVELTHRPIDETRVAATLDLLKRLPPLASGPTRKNPRAVFVLSPPRSGSTLFRVLLGGHPQLFAPPELQLLNFDSLADRRAAFDTERDRFWLDGTVRAIMEARSCDAQEATRIMDECERQGMSVKDFYSLLQEWIGESIFVDKTPTYALDPQTLQRAEENFSDALYIHLIRHPSPVISSFEEAKLHVFFPPFFRGPHRFGVNELAELIWLISHRNIIDFLKTVPTHRRLEVRFEDLVKRSDEVMTGVAQFLGVPYHPAMTDPFRHDHKSRMTDGVHSQARMLGDVKFHEHKGIEAQAADRKKGRFPEEKLGQPTRQLARALGYTIRDLEEAPHANGHSSASSRHGPAETPRPKCLVRLQDGEAGRRPLFCVHPAGGTATCYGDLARHLGSGLPMYAFQAPGLTGERPRPVLLEDLAARYLGEMRAVQAEGPYQIAGWSVGGVIAFEMTRQLTAQGQQVSLLALFDSDIPRQTERMQRINPQLILAELAKPYGLDTHAGGQTGEARLQSILDQARGKGILPPDFTTVQLRRMFRHHARVFRANVRAVRRYTPQPSSEPIVIFRPVDRSVTAVTGPKLDWSAFAPDVTICTVPGDHFSMMREPFVASLAEQLKWYLDEQGELDGTASLATAVRS